MKQILAVMLISQDMNWSIELESCPFSALQRDFPCGEQQKQKAVLPKWSLSISDLPLC